MKLKGHLLSILCVIAWGTSFLVSKGLMEKTKAIMVDNKLPVGKMDFPKLFEQPYIRPKNLLSEKVKSINTAKKYLTQMESLGMLSKEKIGKEYIWFNTDLMTILTD